MQEKYHCLLLLHITLVLLYRQILVRPQVPLFLHCVHCYPEISYFCPLGVVVYANYCAVAVDHMHYSDVAGNSCRTVSISELLIAPRVLNAWILCGRDALMLMSMRAQSFCRCCETVNLILVNEGDGAPARDRTAAGAGHALFNYSLAIQVLIKSECCPRSWRFDVLISRDQRVFNHVCYYIHITWSHDSCMTRTLTDTSYFSYCRLAIVCITVSVIINIKNDENARRADPDWWHRST